MVAASLTRPGAAARTACGCRQPRLGDHAGLVCSSRALVGQGIGFQRGIQNTDMGGDAVPGQIGCMLTEFLPEPVQATAG